MLVSFHPLDPDGYPLRGERIGPAWRQLLAATEADDWVPQLPVMEVMEVAGQVARKTAANLIRNGVNCGFLQRRLMPGNARPRRYELRRTPGWSPP